MKLFKRPNWLKPEIDEGKYWIHIGILAVVVQYILNYFGHNMGALFSIHTLHIALAIVLADVLAHSILKLD